MSIITINVEWNIEAAAWLATSEDVRGLVAEAATYHELVEIVKDLLPDLLDTSLAHDHAIPYQLVSRHSAPIHFS